MQTRKIGKTKLEVTEISFGAAALGGLYRACPREQAMETLQAAWDSGIRYFDVAPWYGLGLAERRVGDFLRDQPDGSYVLSTKVGRLLRPVPTGTVPDYSYVDPLSFDADYDYSYDGIMRSVEFSYARLGLNRIDILYVHDLGGYTHGAAKNAVHQKQFLDSGVKALEELKSSGAISAFGLGVNEVPVCLDVMRHADLDCILMAGRYTLLDRSAVAELLPLCRQKGTSLVVGGVFNSGILATGPMPGSHFDYMPADDEVLAKVGAMEAIAKSHGVPLAAPALQFPLRDPIVASVLIGTAKPSSLIRNMEIVEPRLADEIYAEFEPYTLVAPPLGAEAVRV
ncbi:D-threo-aldose 1-dehydrogenase [Rhizobium leguminosarum]|uniref:D-threo-aldose 1-dehydrogenase n=1 Tax=Rhizobium leguminosarum TaxID=384 RepID=A0AAE2MFC9_RHILE|nr:MULTISPECIES: aldo/keto reductase [Rhizobium]MBB4288293.1 D-threo-aldose 1-dehydrogenase [Rhizobium leguminosarum]MBB4295615.1 D-threo-aldose 1-dehydrogenase [Rhizobium leguminosarum]MBB4307008.1 D-threo-aldose 1-dehydrogenase [Rhizobium leguminosarum]MBB4417410.1 D-threo-aldose 1-dehydrogenase [Rhizobium leguminosarum]MBB4432254.1 D-threo-aldose 1-dehydrogenase [Rhizobium esperanzae]